MTSRRFRNYDFNPGMLPTGEKNLISDVGNVRVGHVTKVVGDDIRTGVTVIDPGIGDLFRTKLPAAVAIGNGFGKLAGTTQIDELGTLETPIALTNTLAVGPVLRGLVDLTIENTPDLKPFETINAIVGETNDGLVNAIHKNSITSQDVYQAYAQKKSDFSLGCVGAGTGTRAFSWKGGIGSASRKVSIGDKNYTVGALVQTNFGGSLTVMGIPIGQRLGKTDFSPFLKTPDGSCMIVLATDAPLTDRQLKRVAKRGLVGMTNTGSVMAHGSGDYAIAFSVEKEGAVEEDALTAFFLAAAETVEESIYDALFLAETTRGRDGEILEALPVDKVVAMLRTADEP
jgi:D-aminopeptidase